jgi:hypothetical protein
MLYYMVLLTDDMNAFKSAYPFNVHYFIIIIIIIIIIRDPAWNFRLFLFSPLFLK